MLGSQQKPVSDRHYSFLALVSCDYFNFCFDDFPRRKRIYIYQWGFFCYFVLICSSEGPSPKTISNIGGLHQMVGLHEYGFAAVARDSIQCLPECGSTNKTGASFETPCGRRLVHNLTSIKLLSYFSCKIMFCK